MKTTTTTTTNNCLMLYTDLFRFGHWETFLNYAWKCTDLAQLSGCHSSTAWSSTVTGKEDEQIRELFDKSRHAFDEVVAGYLNEVIRSNKDHCLRCNSGFRDDGNDFCGICGWDYINAARLEQKSLEQAMEVNERLNAQKIQHVLALYKLNQLYKQADQETLQLSESCKVLESEEQEILTNIKDRRIALAEKQRLKDQLQVKQLALEEEIKEMNGILRSTDSLYKSFKPLKHSLTINLRVEGYILMASSRQALHFPAGLIMALKQANMPGDDIIKNACCFVFIKKEDWQKIGENKWHVDLTLQAKKVKPGSYQVQFTHLYPDENSCKIDFTSKKLTF